MFIEIGVNELNTLYRSTGLVTGQIYRIINSGNLEPNALTVKFGDFVKWDGSKWVRTTTKLATVADVEGAINESTNDVLDDHDPAETTITDTSKSFYDNHELGYYYAIDGKIWLCIEHTRSGAPDSYTYSTTLTKLNGIVPALNTLGMIDLGEKTESDLTDGVYTVTVPNSCTSLTLTTAAALTVKGNPGLGNFEMLIDNSGNANDVTVTVKSNDGQTTYLHSSAAGTDVAAGKIAQLTCVGTCWTLAEFEAPTP